METALIAFAAALVVVGVALDVRDRIRDRRRDSAAHLNAALKRRGL
jgi:hypothetical protein